MALNQNYESFASSKRSKSDSFLVHFGTAKAKFGEQRGAEKFMNIYILDTYINSPVSEYKLNTDGKYMPILF